MVAFILVLIAIPVQLMGFATTCTQGADGSFGTGALFSVPLLAISAPLLVRMAYSKDSKTARRWSLSVLAAALLLVFLTRDVSLNVITAGTACGPDYANYPSGLNGLILAGYLAAPAIVIAVTAFVAILHSVRLSRAWEPM